MSIIPPHPLQYHTLTASRESLECHRSPQPVLSALAPITPRRDVQTKPGDHQGIQEDFWWVLFPCTILSVLGAILGTIILLAILESEFFCPFHG